MGNKNDEDKGEWFTLELRVKARTGTSPSAVADAVIERLDADGYSGLLLDSTTPTARKDGP